MDAQSPGKYTSYFLDLIKVFMEDAQNSEVDIEWIKESLDSDDFRPFSERLLAFMNEKNGTSMEPDEAARYLFRKINSVGLPKSRNAVKGWFNASAPQYGDTDRESIYIISFALDLTVEEITKLFNKVHLDNAFNLRNSREFIYLYCVHSGKSYAEAQKLVAAASTPEDAESDQTVLTTNIGEFALSAGDDADIVDFVLQHPGNFSHDHRTAMKTLERLKGELQGSDEKPGLAQQEYEQFQENKTAYGNSKKSLDFVLKMLNGGERSIEGASFPTIKNVFVRKEITTNFPNSETFANSNPSSYILRKELILLYFYWYWVKVRLYRGGGSFDGFIAETNSMLSDCGFQPLYAGNPYDCLFMYCASCYSDSYNPLNVYRYLLGCADDEEDSW